jgi:hypothetical protein
LLYSQFSPNGVFRDSLYFLVDHTGAFFAARKNAADKARDFACVKSRRLIVHTGIALWAIPEMRPNSS